MAEVKKNPYNSTTFGNSLSLRVDGAIGAMSLSPNGRDVVLAGRRGLFIIDLDDPFMTPRWLRHITSWEVADVQWSPHHNQKPSWCISTSNQKALLWDLARPSSNAILNVLHKHTRAITDINFHPCDPEVLATCSVDTFILSWDMRTPRKPVAQWAEWKAGASQVKWNHENQFEIVSSHDNVLYVWDSRKGSLPVYKVLKAHDSKINGIDISNGLSNLITCSNDNTIKLWDLTKIGRDHDFSGDFSYFANHDKYASEISPMVVTKTDFPVLRARSIPFGSEKAFGIIPLRGGNNSVHVVNYDAALKEANSLRKTVYCNMDPAYSFKGHNSPIKDFIWRTRHQNYSEFKSKRSWKDYQLVTWSSSDFDLKLWPHDEELYKSVNYNPEYQKILRFDPVDSEEEEGEEVLGSNAHDKGAYSYESYCIEPRISLDDYNRNNNGDNLSSAIAYSIAESHVSKDASASKFNNLDWISNVRLGRINEVPKIDDSGVISYDNPNSLSEEVAIVGHKFSKIRFEKISVSTGELVLSLWATPSEFVISEDEIKKEEELKEPIEDQVAASTKASPKQSNNKGILSSANDLNLSNQNMNNNTSLTAPNIHKAASKNITMTSPNVIGASRAAEPSTLASSTSEGAAAFNISSNNVESTIPSSNVNKEEDLQEQKLIFIRIEIKFPKQYPFLENYLQMNSKSRKYQKIKKSSSIKFHIEETYELNSAIKDKLIQKLEEISYFYSNKHNKFCLEPCLRYLMGENIELLDNLVDSLNSTDSEAYSEVFQEVGAEGWADDLIQQQPNMSFSYVSSDEEKEILDFMPEVDDDMNRAKEMSAEEPNNPYLVESGISNKDIEKEIIDSTPVPKGCSAIWSQTGQLVCFFITKPNPESKANENDFETLKFTNNVLESGAGNSKNFEQTKNIEEAEDMLAVDLDNEHFPKKSMALVMSGKTTRSIFADGYNSDSTNDYYDQESESSSTDESSYEFDDFYGGEVMPGRIPKGLRTSYGFGNEYMASFGKYRKGGGSNLKSSMHGDTEGASSKKRSHKSFPSSTNVVTILDFSYLLPDRYDLACEYRILGDSPSKLAIYNSQVANRHGLTEISKVWRILSQILANDLPYPDIRTGINYIDNDMSVNPATSNRFQYYWGTHPFGGVHLIKKIMNYFEMTGNVQMLAMLSCILFENTDNIKRSRAYNVPVHTPYKALPSADNLPSSYEFVNPASVNNSHLNALDPYRVDAPSRHDRYLNWELNRRQSSSTFSKQDYKRLIKDGRNDISASSSFGSSKENLSGRLGSMRKNIQVLASNIDSHSFEGGRELAHSLIGSFNTRNSFSNPSMRKQPYSNLSKFSGNKGKSYSNKSKYPTISYELCNVKELDLFETTYSSLLLDFQEENKIKNYREQYGEMLYAWGLLFNRIKILKFNYPSTIEHSDSCFSVHMSGFGYRKNKTIKHSQDDGIPRSSILKMENSNWSSPTFLNKFCALCNLKVTKRCSICSNCEHILHANCAVDWWSGCSVEDDFPPECPTGCGCNCLEYKI